MSASLAMSVRATRTEANKHAVADFERTSHSVSSRSGFAHPLVLVCECGIADCDGEIEASVYEYETVHRHGGRFFVKPSDDHYSPQLERVLVHSDRYWVVEVVETRAESARRRLLEAPLSIRT